MAAACRWRRPLPVRRPPGGSSPLAPGGIGTEEQWQGKVRGKPPVEEPTLADLRLRLASSVAFAARRLWRRADLEGSDEVVLDLLCEALQRIGHQYRPKEGEPAVQALASAPSHIRELVQSLAEVALPGQQGVEKLEAKGSTQVDPIEILTPTSQLENNGPASTDAQTSFAEIASAPGGKVLDVDDKGIENSRLFRVWADRGSTAQAPRYAVPHLRTSMKRTGR